LGVTLSLSLAAPPYLVRFSGNAYRSVATVKRLENVDMPITLHFVSRALRAFGEQGSAHLGPSHIKSRQLKQKRERSRM
jgi:hypothetical protein